MRIIPQVDKRKPLFKGHKELMKKIDTDFYTGQIVPFEERSTEHILPKSKNGYDYIANYAMTKRQINHERGNLDLKEWLKLHPEFVENMEKYIHKYWNLRIDNIRYGKTIAKTLDLMGVHLWA